MPTLFWAVLAHYYWTLVRTPSPHPQALRLLPTLTGLVAVLFLMFMVEQLLTADSHGHDVQRLLEVAQALSMVAIAPVCRHFVTVLRRPLALSDERPGPRWLSLQYGSAVLVGAVIVLGALRAVPVVSPTWASNQTIALAYLALMVLLATRDTRGQVQTPLRLYRLQGRLPDRALMVGGIVAIVGFGILTGIFAGGARPGLAGHVVIVGIGLAGALVLALRGLDVIIGRVLMTAAAILVAGAIHVGARVVSAALQGSRYLALVDLAAVLALVACLVAGQSWLRAAIDQLILRGRRGRRLELEVFLRQLSPESGALECCRRALAEIARVLPVQGAAILFSRDGTTVVHGGIDVEPLRRVWPTGPAVKELPTGPFSVGWTWAPTPPLRQALLEADVSAVVPLVSPRQRWGDLFASTGLLGSLRDEDTRTLKIFADQLALVLDSADLLGRSLAAERSLAHAQKLAAIGELSARIAHDLRNPLTAARSLTQALLHEPGSLYRDEHALILGELERIERQVSAVLRFARREEFCFAPVDLGGLVRATVKDLQRRLDEAGVTAGVEAPDGIVVRADQEKIRQALINLLENAMDALRDTRGERHISIAIGATDGVATLRLTDTGPGVSPDDLPHLFEPFFSRKEQGTGLGLAIVKRTVDAHGGGITALSGPNAGVTFRIELPLAART